MQKESKVLCKYCWKALNHSSVKKSETNALHKHLKSKKCKAVEDRFTLNTSHKKVRIYHTDLSHLLMLFRLTLSLLFTLSHNLISQYLMTFFSHSYSKQIFYFVSSNMIVFKIFLSSANQVFRFCIKLLSRQLFYNSLKQHRRKFCMIFHHHIKYHLL